MLILRLGALGVGVGALDVGVGALGIGDVALFDCRPLGTIGASALHDRE